MKDVVATLGQWNTDGPVHVELVAHGVREVGGQKAAELGLEAITRALASCPRTSVKGVGPASVQVESVADSLIMSLKVGRVTVRVVIRAEADRIADNADVAVYEGID